MVSSISGDPPEQQKQNTQNPNPSPNSYKEDDDEQQQQQKSVSSQTLTLTLETPNSNPQNPDLPPDENQNQQQRVQKSEEQEQEGMSSSSSPTPPVQPITDTHLTITINDQVIEDPPLTSPRPSVSRRGNKRKRYVSFRKREAVQKKFDLLVQNMKPIPFVPNKSLDFVGHEKLLKGLGLWEFVHVELERSIRVDLVAQLVVNYSSQGRCSYINEKRISVNRADLTRALKLPLPGKKDKSNVVELESDSEMASDESIAFVEDLLSNWVLLHEDMWMMPKEVLNWTRVIKEGHPEKVDWASLMWFMVEKEVGQGSQLTNCYYASHLQCLIKSQCQWMFEEPKVDLTVKEDEEEDFVDMKTSEHGGDMKTSEHGGDMKTSEHGGDMKTSEHGGDMKMSRDGGDIKASRDGGDIKPSEDDGDMKMSEDGGDMKRSEDGGYMKTSEDGGDIKTSEDGGDIKTSEDGGDIKTSEDGGDIKTSEDCGDIKMSKDGHDLKTGKDDGDLKIVEGGDDVKMYENGDNVKQSDDGDAMKMHEEYTVQMGEDGDILQRGGDMDDEKMGNEGAFEGHKLQELNTELSLGQDNLEKEQVVEDDVMDFEESKEEEPGQWGLNCKNSADENFLRRCTLDQDRDVVCDEEKKQEDQEDEVEEQEQQARGFTLSPKCDNIEANLIQEMESAQNPFSSPMQQLHDHSLMEHYTSRSEAIMVQGGPSIFGNSSKREIEHELDSFSQQPLYNKRLRSDGPWEQKSPDFYFCMDQMDQWRTKAKMRYAEIEEQLNMNQQVRINEMQQRDSMIEHLDKVRFDEQQKRQMDIYRFERELCTMGNLLDGYKKALKETRRSFSEYRARYPQHEEPLYRDFPGSGGVVLSAMELEKQCLKQEEEEKIKRLEIQLTLKEFEDEWTGKFEVLLNQADTLASRLLDVGNEVKLFKELFAKRKVSLLAESSPNACGS